MTPRQITVENITEFVGAFELHLIDTDRSIPKTFGKAIKAAGGSYHELRSHYDSKRFVTVPATDMALVLQLIRRYRADAIIARGPRQITVDLSRDGTRNSAEMILVKFAARATEHAKAHGGDSEQYLLACLNTMTKPANWERAAQRKAARELAEKRAADEARARRIEAIESLLASVPDLQRELAELRAAA